MPPSISRREAMIGAGTLVAGARAARGARGATADAAPTSTPTGERTVMIVRHAEKPKGHHEPYGVTTHGKQDKESLTVRGWTRAGALVDLFDPHTGTPLRAGLDRPGRVVAADPAHGSRRPAQTVTPLADKLGHRVVTTWAKGQEARLAAALRTWTGVTLVAWEHEKIPAILSHLGHIAPTPPAHWPGHRFDVVWVLRSTARGWTFAQVPQLLLAGDSATVIS